MACGFGVAYTAYTQSILLSQAACAPGADEEAVQAANADAADAEPIDSSAGAFALLSCLQRTWAVERCRERHPECFSA